MSNLSLILLDCEYRDVFHASDVYNLNYLLKEAHNYSTFLSRIYNIQRFWEVDYFHNFLLDKMVWTTIFYQYSDKRFVVVSDSFTERNIHEKLCDFIKIQKEHCEKISSVVALETLEDRKVTISLLTTDSEKSVIKVEIENGRFKMSSTNFGLFKKILILLKKNWRRL